MKEKHIGYLALAVALTTLIWIILFIISESTITSHDRIEEKIQLIHSEERLYRFTYLNAGLLTFLNIMFMSALFLYCKKKDSFWSTLSFVFVPIYGIANLFSYLSQIFLVPEILELYTSVETQNFAKILLSLTIHTWPGSLVEAINGMAYALLGIPSIILPLIGLREPKLLALGGYLMMTSGIFSILAFIGILTSAGYLTFLSALGGIVFLLSLFPISIYFLKEKPNQMH